MFIAVLNLNFEVICYVGIGKYKDNEVQVPRNSVPRPHLEHLLSSVLGATFKHIDSLRCMQGRVIRVVKELETKCHTKNLCLNWDIRIEKSKITEEFGSYSQVSKAVEKLQEAWNLRARRYLMVLPPHFIYQKSEAQSRYDSDMIPLAWSLAVLRMETRDA